MKMQMSKLGLAAIVLLSAVLLSGCATTTTTTRQNILSENWIDDDDVMFALNNPQLSSWFQRLGNPVLTEMRGDTVEFVYNYRPALFVSGDAVTKVEHKPNNDDRSELWSQWRKEIVVFQVVDNKLVGIRKSDAYAKNAEQQTQKTVETKQNPASGGGILALVLVGAIVLIAGIVSAAN